VHGAGEATAPECIFGMLSSMKGSDVSVYYES